MSAIEFLKHNHDVFFHTLDGVSSAPRDVVSSPELRRRIFKFLPIGCNYVNALVCRAWCNDALDALWYNVPDIWDLLVKLVPWKLWETDYPFNNWRPTSETWDVFLRCSSRVRVLQYGDCEEEWDDRLPSILPTVAVTRPLQCFFPNLKILRFVPGAVEPLLYLPMFLGPNLATLRIDILSMDQWRELSIALSYLHVHSPSLENLEIHVELYGKLFMFEEDEDCVGIRTLKNLKRLKRLKLPFPRSLALLFHIASIPTLSELTLYGTRIPSNPVYILPPLNLPALRSLEVAAAPPSLILGFFQVALDLERLRLTLETHENLDALVSAISKYPNLKEIYITSSDPPYQQSSMSDDVEPTAYLNFDAILKLQPLENLTILSIILAEEVSLEVDADNLIHLCKFFPRLRTLELSNNIDECEEPPNLSTLVEMMPYCRYLESLTLTVDAYSFYVPDYRAEAIFPTLRTWNVGCSTISPDAVEKTALFLSAIFRTDCVVQRYNAKFLCYVSCWCRVGELLDLLGRARQHERALAQYRERTE
ncbi:hypothetical protein ONZ45_g15526 [Pleurotus djamor]|nr:hypothetical protein ONZ45_g15526 [Pleurotus djamor]